MNTHTPGPWHVETDGSSVALAAVEAFADLRACGMPVDRAAFRRQLRGNPMMQSCSWCHTMNDAAAEYCQTCGHRADRPRTQCDCSQCVPALHEAPVEEERGET